MMYLYYGTDEQKARMHMQRAVSKLRSRAPEAHYERMTDETASGDGMRASLRAAGLFYPKQIIVLDHALSNASFAAELFELLPELADTEHIVFILEGTLKRDVIKKLSRYATQVEVHDVERTAAERFNPFALSDALFAADGLRAWTAYRQALAAGSAPEALHGMLFWGAKVMALAGTTDAPANAGLKPFVFNKGRTAARRFGALRTQQLVRDLAALPHEARRSGEELEYALERFLLRTLTQ